jgi:outer membrane receptor protein involved in Fe transport
LREQQMVWAAISRSLRTPSEIDTASELTLSGLAPPGGPPVVIRIVGNPAFQDEQEITYEAGYRILPSDHLSLDLTAYDISYSQLQSSEPEPSFSETDPPPTLSRKSTCTWILPARTRYRLGREKGAVRVNGRAVVLAALAHIFHRPVSR